MYNFPLVLANINVMTNNSRNNQHYHNNLVQTEDVSCRSASFHILVTLPCLYTRWSLWTEWSGCSVSCGSQPGRRTRSRTQTGSRVCAGREEEEKVSYTQYMHQCRNKKH